MDESTPEFVQVGDLPESLLASISARISHYTIAFIKLVPSPHGDEPRLLGSGVLARAGTTYAILTAAHVLPLLPTAGTLCILLEPTPQPHVVETIALTYLSIGHGSVDSNGPDLAAVILAPSVASSLAAKKSFCNLDRWRDEALRATDEIRDGVWVVQGWLNERIVVVIDPSSQERTTRFYNFSGFGGPDPSFTLGEHDYFDFVYERRTPDVAPGSWGGVSGGGLWKVTIKREAGSITDIKSVLTGIAFYQAEQAGSPFSIRCHGIRSIYERAYEAMTVR